jgi:hypothetical protein
MTTTKRSRRRRHVPSNIESHNRRRRMMIAYRTNHRVALLSGLTAALAVAMLPAAARAQLGCGDVVGPGQKVTLTGNLGPCDDVARVVTVNGGTLDLGGFTISCADTDGDNALPTAVELDGKKSRVTNGTVTGCFNGVTVSGTGKHTVQGVNATGNAVDGIQVRSNGNKILGNTTASNGDEGIEVLANKNKILQNVSTGNGSDGIDVDGDTKGNKIQKNQATGNGGADLQNSDGSCKGNKWKKNVFGTRSSSCIK